MSQSSPTVIRQIGPYRLEREVGSGAAGKVFRAIDARTGNVAAVKLVSDAAWRARFVREIDTLSRLVHPGIVRYLDHGETTEGLYLAMEWLEGEDLAAHLARGRLTWQAARALAMRLTEALAHAHALGAVHRDLKPSNVFLPAGRLTEAKLLDFGLVRVENGVDQTASRAVVGTPSYMAPEQVRNAKNIDGRADLFSLGALLFEALSGVCPFHADDLYAVWYKIVEEPPPDLRRIAPDVPESLVRLVEALLAKDPAERPPSAVAVHRALFELDPSPIGLAPTAMAPPLDLALAPTATAPPLALAPTATAPPLARPPPQVEPSSSTSTSQNAATANARTHVLVAVIVVLLSAGAFAGALYLRHRTRVVEVAASAHPPTVEGGAASDPVAPLPTVAPAAPLPTGEGLSLVAVGQAPGAKILWLTAHGSRVWLSGRNFDAFADGDAELSKKTDPLRGLSYQPGKHALLMTGTYPHLYVLRYERREVPALPSEPTVFVSTPRGWIEAKPLVSKLIPVAFVPWGEGALVVHSQVGPSYPAGDPSYSPDLGPGTELQYFGPDGATSEPKLGIERTFMAWSADSDGKTLSLLGTVRRDPPGADPEYTIEVARGSAGTLTRTPLFRTKTFAWAEISRARVRELGSRALVVSPWDGTELGTWKPNGLGLYEVGGSTPRPITVTGPSDRCRVRDALIDGEGATLAIRACLDGRRTLLRVTAKVEEVLLPAVARGVDGFRLATSNDEVRFVCEPSQLLLRGATDLWVRGECSDGHGSTVPAVFRRGHAQEALLLP